MLAVRRFNIHTTDQALTLLGPAEKPTPGGAQTTRPEAASALRALATVLLHGLRHGRLAVSVRLAAAPAHAQALLTVGHRVLGRSLLLYKRHTGQITLTLTLDLRGLRRLLRHESLRTALRVTVAPSSTRAAAVELDRSLTVRR